MYDYVFSENGLVAFKDGKLFSKMVCINLTLLSSRLMALSLLLLPSEYQGTPW